MVSVWVIFFLSHFNINFNGQPHSVKETIDQFIVCVRSSFFKTGIAIKDEKPSISNETVRRQNSFASSKQVEQI